MRVTAFVEPPPLEPRTSLWGLAHRFYAVSSNFYTLAGDIEDEWLLGTYLSIPFYLLSDFFQTAGDLTIEADDKLVDVSSWVRGLVEGETFSDILAYLSFDFGFILLDAYDWFYWRLDTLSWHFRDIVQDPLWWVRDKVITVFPNLLEILEYPLDWIRDRIADISYDLTWFIDDPWGYVRNKVLSIFGWANDLDADASYWVISWISERYAWIWDFLTYPSNWIITWLTDQYPWMWDFFTSPSSWVIQFIRQYNTDLALFIDNPIEFVREKVLYILEYEYDVPEPLPIVLLEAIITQLWTMGDSLVHRLFQNFVDFLIRFL